MKSALITLLVAVSMVLAFVSLSKAIESGSCFDQTFGSEQDCKTCCAQKGYSYERSELMKMLTTTRVFANKCNCIKDL